MLIYLTFCGKNDIIGSIFLSLYVMDVVYDDPELTSDNIGATVKYALCCQDVILTVANLYLRQQLIFDRI